jgi:hypothetical protein
MSMPRIEEVVDEKTTHEKMKTEEKQKTIQEIINDAEEKNKQKTPKSNGTT